MKNLKQRLLFIAQCNFDFNHRAGRRGKEWSIEKEVTYQAFKRIEKLERRLIAINLID